MSTIFTKNKAILYWKELAKNVEKETGKNPIDICAKLLREYAVKEEKSENLHQVQNRIPVE